MGRAKGDQGFLARWAIRCREKNGPRPALDAQANPAQIRGALQRGPDVFGVVLHQLRLAICPKLYGGVSQQVKEGLVDCIHHEAHVARTGVLPVVEKRPQQCGFILGEPQVADVIGLAQGASC